MTNEELKLCKTAFTEALKDDSRTINLTETIQIVNTLDFVKFVRNDEIKKLFDETTEHINSIDEAEFVEMVKNLYTKVKIDSYTTAFIGALKDNSHTINLEETQKIVKDLGFRRGQDVVLELFDEITAHSNSIDEAGFVELMKKLQAKADYKNEYIYSEQVIFISNDYKIYIELDDIYKSQKYDRSNFQHSINQPLCMFNFNSTNKSRTKSCEPNEKCYKRYVFRKANGTYLLTDTQEPIYFYIYSGTHNKIPDCIDITKSVIVFITNKCNRVIETKIEIVTDQQDAGAFMKKSKKSNNTRNNHKMRRLSKKKTGCSSYNNTKLPINKMKRRS
jgi:Ca2+-binding EF-hand superfamily protein